MDAYEIKLTLKTLWLCIRSFHTLRLTNPYTRNDMV